MKQIEKYIQFVKNNGLEGLDNFKIHENIKIDNVNTVKGLFISYVDEKKGFIFLSIEKLLQSKPFIEAVARGIFDKSGKTNLGKPYYDNIIRVITENQAIAIRDNKLEEFIENILPKK